MDANEIKAIVFDAYGTLLDVRTIDELLHTIFDDRAGPVARIWRQKQLEYTWLRTLMLNYTPFQTITADALRYACKVNGIELEEQNQEALLEAYDELLIFEDVAPALKRLKKQFRLAVLSNANPSMLENSIAHNKIQKRFEAIISVDETRHFKPYPAVYVLAEKKLELDRSEILFISSNTWDVAGAKSFGLKVAWVNRLAGYVEELGLEPDLVVTDLEELAEELLD